jgi:D-beta-D-heptose 7-phosphate kinase/D-beta-D-heptose 1-phosphate adenosyltransferase
MAEKRKARSAEAELVLRRFPRVRVLVAGDLMLDQFVWGRVQRISPEAPVPVVQVTAESFRLGGAGNVVHNLRSLGGRAIACGTVGDDAHGRRLLEELSRIGADASGVMRTREYGTTCKTRIIAHQQQVVRLDREESGPADTRGAARARGYLLANLLRADVVVISDYGKGMINEGLLQALAAIRRRRPFPLIIDPKQLNFDHYRFASLVTPNRDEASRASGVEIVDEASLARAGAELLRRWEAEAVLVTRGEEGMSLFRAGAAPRHFPTVARQVFDVTGAGDTVLATCALAVGAGASWETTALLANHAAGIVVGEVGTAAVTVPQLRADLRDHSDRAIARPQRVVKGKSLKQSGG